jgi:hypothetical protein
MSAPLASAGERGLRAAARSALLADPLRGGRLSILLYHRVLPQADPLFPGEVAHQFSMLGLRDRSIGEQHVEEFRINTCLGDASAERKRRTTQNQTPETVHAAS